MSPDLELALRLADTADEISMPRFRSGLAVEVKADLTPVVRREGGGSVITVRRLNEDRCANARPEGVEVRWSFEELGLEPGARVSVENPYQMPPA